MKYLYNPATDEFESLTPTLRDRFDLKDQVADASAAVQGTEQAIDLSVDSFKAYQNAGGTMSYKDFIASGNEGVSRFFKDGGRVNFSKGGSAKLTELLNLLPDGTEVTRDIVQKLIDDNNLDITVKNYFARPSKNLKTGISLDKRMSPIKVTDELLDKVDNYIKNTPLNLKAIGEDLGYKPTKKGQGGQLRSTSPLINAYEAKYGKISEDRFKPYKLDANSNYVKRVINLREKLGSTNAVANELGLDNKTIRNVLSQFRKDLMGDVNVPGPDTGAKAQKKRRILKEKEGTRQLSDSEKLFNKEQEKVVKDLNNDFKKNPSKVLNNSKLINLLNLKLEKGNIISKNKTKKQILESINRQGGLLDIEHIDDIATGKKNVQYPVNRQITTYNVNSGFLRSVANYVNGPDADPAKIANIEKTLKQYGLRVKTNKGIIGAEMIGAKDNVKRNLDAAGIKYDNVVKPPQSLTKKGLKFAAKQIPLASFLIGTADAATAFKQGVRNPLDLYTAYEVSPEVALKSKAMREDKTGKLLQQEITNLPEITTDDQVAGLLEESGSPYMQFLQDGGQLSFEEFQKMQSIPQSERPITGELDLPEMDQTMMAAQGGRVGFQDGTSNPVFDQIIAALDNTNLINNLEEENKPTLKEEVYGEDGDRNLLQTFNTMFADPEAYPYYAQELVSGASNIPELAFRFPFAVTGLVSDVATGKGDKLKRAMETLDPKLTKAIKEKIGFTDMLEKSRTERTEPQKTTGGILELGAEIPGPATPYFLIKAFPKIAKQIKNLVGTGTAAEKVNKEIENKMATQGVDQTRRDILLATGAGGAMALLKYLGLDNLVKTTKAVKAAPEIVTKGGTPKYFFDFVNLIKTKGDDITDKAATLERQKVYDYNGYTMTEDISTGKISINKDTEGGASYYIGDGEYDTVDGIIRKEEIVYDPPETILDDAGKPKKVPDIYEENTLSPDYDGGDGDIQGGLDSIDEILELLAESGEKYNLKELTEMGMNPEGLGLDLLKRILRNPDEIKLLDSKKAFKDTMNKVKYKIEKAEGGIIAGVSSGPPPKSGPTPHGLPYVAKNVRPIKERK